MTCYDDDNDFSLLCGVADWFGSLLVIERRDRVTFGNTVQQDLEESINLEGPA